MPIRHCHVVPSQRHRREKSCRLFKDPKGTSHISLAQALSAQRRQRRACARTDIRTCVRHALRHAVSLPVEGKPS